MDSSRFSYPRTTSNLLCCLALTTAIAGCSSRTDDVYTADERRPDVGAVARGEAAFPVAVGSLVPDANGMAKPLTPTMRGVRITFQDILVDRTCDSGTTEDGEFYYRVNLDDRRLALRDSDHYQSAPAGGSIPIEATRVFFVEPDERFTLQLSVWDADGMLNGADDFVGERRVTYTASDLGRNSLWETVPLGKDDCAVRMTYALERVQ